MIVNSNRYLINDQSKVCDEVCEAILKTYPSDAQIEFDNVKKIDYDTKFKRKGFSINYINHYK